MFISLLNVHWDLPVYLEYHKSNYIGSNGVVGVGQEEITNFYTA